MENQEPPALASAPAVNLTPANAEAGPTVARKPCPSCGEMIAETAKKCRFCGEAIGGGAVPAANVAGGDSAERLSTGEKIGVYLGVALTGFTGMVAVLAIYCVWRDKHPQKATQLFKHGWIAFGIFIVLCIFSCYLVLSFINASH
ncbi:MAG: hypothetical protein J6333_10225 [Planctomycetes bacterium]|nr:hypothetical protein [Planctomycetota bacterium]